MKPTAFSYARAETLDQALALMAEHGEDARLLAGGQSLMATLNMRLSEPALLVDINRLPGLDAIERDGNTLRIGALVRHAALGRSKDIADSAPLIAAAVPHIAHLAIRNRGTVGGSIAFADPAAELPACLLALGGTVEVAGSSGTRNVAADDFFKGLYETDLAPGDMITAVTVPAAGKQDRFGFAEIARRHGDYALVGLAAAGVRKGKDYETLRLAYFGVGEVPLRARGAEAAITGGEGVDAAIAALKDDLAPFDDIHATRAVRLHLAGVLLRRVLGDMEGEAA